MCGIVGGSTRVPHAALRRSLCKLSSRGPDGEGTWFGQSSFLGCRRLAVVARDCPSGPYHSELDDVHLAANGEVYNEPELRVELERRGHVFRTNVDVEVLIHAYEEWGQSFVERLDGMFAFIIVDERRRLVTAGRDPLGIKPLYFGRVNDGIVYASTCDALLAVGSGGGGLCPRGLIEHLYRQGVRPPRTVYRGIQSVSPGTTHVHALGGSSHGITRYWKPKPRYEVGETSRTGDGNSVELLDAVLQAACAAQLRRDRPARLALSGGIDSGLLASALQRLGRLEGAVFLPNDVNTADLALARATAGRFGIDLELLRVRGRLTQAVSDWVSSSDRPPADGFNTYLLCRSLPEGTVVLYSGLGADELFGGYPELAAVVTASGEDGVGERFLDATALMPPVVLDAIGAELGVDWAEAVGEVREEAIAAARGSAPHGPAEILRTLLLQNYLSSCLLPDADDYSMCVGVEIRVPFLSRFVADLALGTPPSALGLSKPMLRALAARRGLPAYVVSGPKRGFALDYDELSRPFAGSMAARLLPKGHPATAYRTWVLGTFGLWLRRHGVALSTLEAAEGASWMEGTA